MEDTKTTPKRGVLIWVALILTALGAVTVILVKYWRARQAQRLALDRKPAQPPQPIHAEIQGISEAEAADRQVEDQDNEIHVRIIKNTGGGFYSPESVRLSDIQSVLEEHPEGTPVTSFMLQPLFHGKSVNTPKDC